MSTARILLIIFVMMLCTYLPRALPLALFRKKIKNRYISSLLCYLPYGILAAMVFPAIFSSTAALVSAIAGTLVALILAWRRKGLLVVSVSACAAVFIVERILDFAHLL